MSNLPATQSNQAIFARFAQRFGLDSNKVSSILKNTAFKIVDKNNPNREASDEQMAALLVVADQFNLNPFVKEIYAFPDSTGRGIIPIVPIDGWARIANEHPQYDGVEYTYADETVRREDKDCPIWIEAIIYRKDRSHPTKVREYLDECYRTPINNFKGPWQSHPRRMLRHKAFMQCARIALSFSGVYDEDEAERIAAARLVELPNAMPAPIDISPQASLPPAEEFEDFLQQSGFAGQKVAVDAYLGVCAKHYGKSIDEVKTEICRRPEDFIKAFPAWVKSIEQQKQSKKQKPAGKEDKKADPAPSPEQVPAQPEAAPPPAATQAKLTHDPQTGEIYGGANMITCPKNKRQVDELDCVSKSCRDGCPMFDF